MKPQFIIIIVALLSYYKVYTQKQCATDEQVVDLNTITKCSINDVKETLSELETKQIRTRKKRKKVVANNSLNVNKLHSVDSKSVAKIDQIKSATDKLAPLKKIPFYMVDQIPLFKKCKNTPLIKQTKCFEKQMAKHIFNNFNYPQEALRKKIEGKILVQFTINKEGKVIDIKKKGPENSDILKEEAERLISKLPNFIPGKHNGENVLVKYALPIIFKTPKRS
ncbi:periplasmic protein TonB [Tenacibaculum sp. 190524A02b]|uniref:Periplasmic protein TonB n=1 Tax=Tenacibaculum vairaonense TaxID=3137860 RepID=A0ABM9PGI5_9FLAO